MELLAVTASSSSDEADFTPTTDFDANYASSTDSELVSNAITDVDAELTGAEREPAPSSYKRHRNGRARRKKESTPEMQRQMSVCHNSSGHNTSATPTLTPTRSARNSAPLPPPPPGFLIAGPPASASPTPALFSSTSNKTMTMTGAGQPQTPPFNAQLSASESETEYVSYRMTQRLKYQHHKQHLTGSSASKDRCSSTATLQSSASRERDQQSPSSPRHPPSAVFSSSTGARAASSNPSPMHPRYHRYNSSTSQSSVSQVSQEQMQLKYTQQYTPSQKFGSLGRHASPMPTDSNSCTLPAALRSRHIAGSSMQSLQSSHKQPTCPSTPRHKPPKRTQSILHKRHRSSSNRMQCTHSVPNIHSYSLLPPMPPASSATNLIVANAQQIQDFVQRSMAVWQTMGTNADAQQGRGAPMLWSFVPSIASSISPPPSMPPSETSSTVASASTAATVAAMSSATTFVPVQVFISPFCFMPPNANGGAAASVDGVATGTGVGMPAAPPANATATNTPASPNANAMPMRNSGPSSSTTQDTISSQSHSTHRPELNDDEHLTHSKDLRPSDATISSQLLKSYTVPVPAPASHFVQHASPLQNTSLFSFSSLQQLGTIGNSGHTTPEPLRTTPTNAALRPTSENGGAAGASGSNNSGQQGISHVEAAALSMPLQMPLQMPLFITIPMSTQPHYLQQQSSMPSCGCEPTTAREHQRTSSSRSACAAAQSQSHAPHAHDSVTSSSPLSSPPFAEGTPAGAATGASSTSDRLHRFSQSSNRHHHLSHHSHQQLETLQYQQQRANANPGPHARQAEAHDQSSLASRCARASHSPSPHCSIPTFLKSTSSNAQAIDSAQCAPGDDLEVFSNTFSAANTAAAATADGQQDTNSMQIAYKVNGKDSVLEQRSSALANHSAGTLFYIDLLYIELYESCRLIANITCKLYTVL